MNLEKGTGIIEAKAGTVEFLLELEKQRAIKVGISRFYFLHSMAFAYIIYDSGLNVIAGVWEEHYNWFVHNFLCWCLLFSILSSFQLGNKWSMAHFEGRGSTLSCLYRIFLLSVSCFVIALILNITFLYLPVLDLPRSSFKAYINDWNGRGWALLAGLLCGFGNGIQFMGGQAAGYAAADAVQVHLVHL